MSSADDRIHVTFPDEGTGRAPSLLYDDVESDLRASVRALLGARCDTASVLARCESAQPYDLDTWQILARDVGVAALLVPDEHGGAGASAREAAVVAEELGRSAAPVPFLGSAVLATSALLACPDPDPVLADLASGQRTATLAVALTTAPEAAFPQGVRAEAGALHGRVSSVVDLTVADVAVVPVHDADGPGLYLVDLPGDGATVRPVTGLDLTRQIADLELDGAVGRRIAGAADTVGAVRFALGTGAALLAAEQLGIAQWCLDTTVAYAKERHQFGRPIGSFQAVKHRLADLWAAVTSARATSRAVADALARGADDTALLVALAAAHCSEVAVLAAEECVQLHGGIGMTWEHPAHLYLGRAKIDELALGTPDRHRTALAELIDLPSA